MYSIGLLILLPPALLCGLIAANKRKVVITCIIFGIASMLLRGFAIRDYWSPVYLISAPYEEFIYGCLIACITSVLPEYRHQSLTLYTKVRNFLIYIVVGELVTHMLYLTNYKSIVYMTLLPVIIGIVSMILGRSRLRLHLLNGLILCFVSLVTLTIWAKIEPDLFKIYWMRDFNPMVLDVPVWELVFSFSLGFGAYGFYSNINFDAELVRSMKNLVKGLISRSKTTYQG